MVSQFVVTCGERPKLLQPQNASLDQIAIMVLLRIELERATAFTTFGFTVLDLITTFRDQRFDTARSNFGTASRITVAFVAHTLSRPLARATTTGSRQANGIKDTSQISAVAFLARADDSTEWQSLRGATEMDFGTESAAAAA